MTISATTQGLRPGVCTSSNRPANPFDGMMIYETDTNLVRIWNGTAWKTLSYSDATSGSVLQVQSTTKTDTFSTTSSTYVDITGLSVSITPTSTSSKVFVMVCVFGDHNNLDSGMVQLLRDSTAISIGDAAGSRSRASTISSNFESNRPMTGALNFLDSPSTTSSTTYKLQLRVTSGTAFINRSSADTDNSAHMRAVSSITVMEIAG